MNDLYQKVLEVLKQDSRFFTENGELLRNAVYEAAMKMDSALIKMLYENETTKSRFFTVVDDIAVFDKVGFGWVINNRQFLPDSFTRYKNKIGLVDNNGEFISSSDNVVLSFPYKDCVLEFDSTDENEKRTEIFYNETLCHDDIDHLFSRKVFSNAQRYTATSVENISSFNDENLIIKGNNLLSLYSLLDKYAGKIKCMYWDILYNTNSDQVPYNDSFKHSSWLTMMKNRLEVAKKLLSNDGIIFIHLDSNEMAYLKVLLDEIFDRENYLGMFTCKVKAPSGVASGAQMIFDCSEYILSYAKSSDTVSFNHLLEEAEIVDEKSKTSDFYKYILENISYEKMEIVKDLGDEKVYRITKDNFEINVMTNKSSLMYYLNYKKIFRTAALSGGREKEIAKIISSQPDALDSLFIFEHTPKKGKKAGQLCRDLIYKNGGVLMLSDFCKVDDKKKQITKLQHITSILANDWWQGISKEGNVTLNNGKKPEVLLKTLIEMSTNEGDIVLDAYFGTGTTGAVALKMNRKFIGLEQLNSHFEKSKQRLIEVINGDSSGISSEVNWQGGGSFISVELKTLNQKYIESIKMAENNGQLVTIWQDIQKSGFISSYVSPQEIDPNADDFKSLSLDDKKRLFLALLDKNMLYVNYCDIDDENYDISEADKAFTNSFYKES